MTTWTILGDIVVLLGTSVFVGGLFARFGQSPIVGYLLAGMMLGGPGSFHVVSSEHEIEAVAELGVALLLFSLGLEFSLDRLKKLGTRPLFGGLAQVVITILLTSAVASVTGLPPDQAIALGAMVALSSTAIVLRILMERGEMETPHGRNALGVLLTQDMAVVPLALMMTVLGRGGTTAEIAFDLGKIVLLACALIVGLFLLKKIVVLALGTLTFHRNRELTVVFSAVAGLGAAWASQCAGISPALGAFVAGMLLGTSVFATQIRADISPLRVVLLTLFFGAAGMVADPVWILTNWAFVGIVVVGLSVGKLLVIWGIFAVLGQSTRVASASALCLAQVGEFAFVLGTIGRAGGVVTEDVYALVVSVAIVSFAASAFLVPVAPRFGNWMAGLLNSKDTQSVGESEQVEPSDVVIIGFGPAGQIVAQSLVQKRVNATVIELNREGIRAAQRMGFRGELGDATQSDVLEHARIRDCKVVVITVPHHESSMTILSHVRKDAPHVYVIVRSRYELYRGAFLAAGAHAVVGDEQEVGESLVGQLKDWLDNDAKSNGRGVSIADSESHV